jgi:putative membrane protein
MMDGFGMGFGGGFMWLIWIGLILAIVWGISGWRTGDKQRTRTPRELLDERYARGDIDEDDYQKRRTTLGN